jgi:hypothetical protein
MEELRSGAEHVDAADNEQDGRSSMQVDRGGRERRRFGLLELAGEGRWARLGGGPMDVDQWSTWDV